MAAPSVTYTFTNGTAADASQVNTNFTNLINGMSDGTKDLSINALTCAGTATLNGAINLGNASSDDITVTGSLASSLPVKTTGTYNFGSATLGFLSMYFGNASNSNTVRVLGGVTTSSYTLTLPVNVGIANDMPYATDASGTLAFKQLTSSSDIQNLTITTSVAASALTIAVKTKAAADASSTTPITIGFRNATAATGTYVTRTITGALSMVVSSGSTLGLVTGSLAQYVYVYAIDNAGTVELAVSHTKLFDDGTIVTTTAEGGAGAADSATTIYSTTARTGVASRLIGRIKFSLSTAGTWDEAGDEISLVPFDNVVIRSQVTVDSGNGHGSTNSNVRRFSQTRLNTGTAITYADSAGNGASFTINEDGLYYACYNDVRSGGAAAVGITVNGSALSTNINSITYAQGKRCQGSGATANAAFCSWTGLLAIGDIVRPQDNGATDSSNAECMMTVTKIGS